MGGVGVVIASASLSIQSLLGIKGYSAPEIGPAKKIPLRL
jgi:hypothetical protein